MQNLSLNERNMLSSLQLQFTKAISILLMSYIIQILSLPYAGSVALPSRDTQMLMLPDTFFTIFDPSHPSDTSITTCFISQLSPDTSYESSNARSTPYNVNIVRGQPPSGHCTRPSAAVQLSPLFLLRQPSREPYPTLSLLSTLPRACYRHVRSKVAHSPRLASTSCIIMMRLPVTVVSPKALQHRTWISVRSPQYIASSSKLARYDSIPTKY